MHDKLTCTKVLLAGRTDVDQVSYRAMSGVQCFALAELNQVLCAEEIGNLPRYFRGDPQ